MGDLMLGAATGTWSAAFALVGMAAALAWCVVRVVREVKRSD